MYALDSRRYVWPFLATLSMCATITAKLAAAPAAAPPSRTQPMAYGAGTLSLANGNYQFAPQGCTHNGNRAICNFYVTYSAAQAGNVNAWAGYYGQWTMNVQLIDNLHVPHGPDTAYFIDGSGAHQPVLFIQQGTQVWVAVEFPNVDASVSTGEFHMGKQIVGGIVIAQPNFGGAASSPQYASSNTVAPAVSTQPQPQAVPAAATTNCVAGTPGYSGAALCGAQDKMNAAKGWKDLLSGFVPAKTNAPPQAQAQPPQMQPPQPPHQ